MSKQANTTETDHRFIPSLLARKFLKDYEASVAEFPEDKKIEFLEHLLGCLEIIETYISSPTKENWKIYANKESAFLKKHGKRLKMYRQKRMYLYYGDNTLLVEKEIFSTKEWNALSKEKQKLSAEEFGNFVHLCRNSLYLERDYLLLEQSPEDEREEKNTKETLAGKSGNQSKKGKVQREAHDKLTCLNQEQTALLMYYLQRERVFLKGENLNDKDMSIAFEILTGYSHHTLRQTVGKFTKSLSKENLKEIDLLLTHLKTAIGEDLKEK